MILKLVKKVVGTKNDRELKRIGKKVTSINAFTEQMAAMDDASLRAKTEEFRARFKRGETLDDLLPEAFAVCREASTRALGMRHFDVQLLGGIALHEGNIAEMRTGEGKTLVATLAAYLNVLGDGCVHLVTVNDYLARRDAGWMGPLYEFLGLTVGVIVPYQSREEKSAAAQSDIIYGTNNELGFDYLRENMALSVDDRVHRKLAFAIVDEVDSILIDEARTPLIISGPAEDNSEMYSRINRLIPDLKPHVEVEEGAEEPLPENMGHYVIDEKTRQVELTEEGHLLVEKLLTSEDILKEGDSLYAVTNLALLQHFLTALRAHVLYQRDVEYIVQDGEVMLIDEHTGRTMPGRRLSEGLHQAIEAKEGVKIQLESQTLASTTFQNYFRLYDKLAGMTGTADTEAPEFHQIYGLDVLVMPTHKPVVRDDMNDLIFLTKAEKFDAIVEDIKQCLEKKAPILVGTASIETSEEMAALLQRHKIKHQVLNAKFHAKEAQIIAQAGRPSAVTIATNMAGRGTDIVLGGNLEVELAELEGAPEEEREALRRSWEGRHQQVLDAGGLHVLGTERHESRRIDNQLRGRSGRQGDPGASRFYLSLEDNLMRIFASDRVKGFMQALGMEKGEAIEHRMVTNAIEKAQRKVEGRNFDMRKSLLEFDDVANEQRQIIYQQRNFLLEADDVSEMLDDIRADVVDQIVDGSVPPGSLYEQWLIPELEQHLDAELGIALPINDWLEEDDNLHEEPLRQRVQDAVSAAYASKCEQIGPPMRNFEKQIMLQILDQLWKEHLASMDHLRQGIHLRAYAQKNPKQEYKRESFELFEEMLASFKSQVVSILSKVQIREEDSELLEQQRREQAERQEQQARAIHNQMAPMAPMAPQGNVAGGSAPAALAGRQPKPGQPPAEPQSEGNQASSQPFVRGERKVGRNEPCPCGSGKKFKQCHGKL
jgi:preprotein translocase subunit SecA